MRQARTALLIPAVAVLTTACISTSASDDDRVVLSRVPGGGIQPEVVVDRSGAVHLVYFAGKPASGNIFYVRSTDQGATFSAPIRVNSQDGSAIATGTIRGAQLAVGRGGRIHVAWNGSASAQPRAPRDPATHRPGAPMLYARSNPEGRAFEPQRNLMTRTVSLDGGGSIAADDEGRVYVAWHANEDGGRGGEEHRQVWLARSIDDGESFERERPVWKEPTGACGCCGMKLFATRAGTLHLLYRSATQLTNRDIYSLSSHDGGETFDGKRLDPWPIAACPMSSMSIVATGQRIFGAWETNGQIMFADLSSVSGKPLAAPGPSSTRKHPRFAVNSAGELLLLWTEGTAWGRGGKVAWHRLDAAGRPTASSGSHDGVPKWSVAAAVPRPDGRFTIFY